MVARDRSKIIPMLEEASSHLPRAARTMVGIAEAPPEDRRSHLSEVEQREVELEQAFFDFLRRVSRTFITPFDREDLVALAKEMDDVLAGVHQTADLIVRLEVGQLPPAVVRLIEDVATMVELIAECVSLLKRPDRLSALWRDAAAVSNRSVASYNQSLAEIFAMDDDPRLLLKHKLVADQVFQVHYAVHRYLTACGVTAIKET